MILKTTCSLFIFLSVLISNAQIMAPKIDGPDPHATQKVDLSKVKGSPYEQETFVEGKIIDEVTKKEKICLIRYNAYTDEVEIKNSLNDKNISSMLKSKGISVISDNKEYRFSKFVTNTGNAYNRISIALLKDSPFSVYKYIEKEFIAGKKAKTSLEKSTSAKFKSIETYYIEKGGILIPLDMHKKRVLKSFPSHKKEVENFIKTNKLRFKNESDLIKVTKYFNSLQ